MARAGNLCTVVVAPGRGRGRDRPLAGLQWQGKGARGDKVWPMLAIGNMVTARLKANGLGNRQSRGIGLARCAVRIFGTPKNRPELRERQPEPVNVLERIAHQVSIYRLEEESQDDNRGNPDFE